MRSPAGSKKQLRIIEMVYGTQNAALTTLVNECRYYTPEPQLLTRVLAVDGHMRIFSVNFIWRKFVYWR